MQGNISVAGGANINEAKIKIYSCPGEPTRCGTYGDRTLIPLTVSQPVSIAAMGFQCYQAGGQFPPCFGFSEWVTNAGTLGNAHSNHTTFTPTSGGFLELLVTDSNYTTNWAGLVESGTNITAAQGTFNLTKAKYTTGVTDGCSNSEVFASWVGIGGWEGGYGLWQAGVAEGFNTSTSSLYAVPFYEYITPSDGISPAFDWGAPLSNKLGDSFQAQVWLNWIQNPYVYHGAYGYFSGGFLITDVTSHTTVWQGSFTFNQSLYNPGHIVSVDRTTAEWITESPGSCTGSDGLQHLNAYVYPSFGSIEFSSPLVLNGTVNYDQWWNPVFNDTGADVWADNSCHPNQTYLNEQLTPAWISGTEFLITQQDFCI